VKKRLLIALVVVLALAATSSVVWAQATLVVDDDGAQCPGPGYTTIQAAVNAASAGDTVFVCPGTYNEQVVIDKSLTLQGAGDTTIVQPSSAAMLTQYRAISWFGGTKQLAAIILADVPGGTVTVKNLKVDGGAVTALPSGANWVAGIFFRETGGTIDKVTVEDMTIGTTGTAVRGYGAYLYAVGASPVSVEVKNSLITNYDKNGINAQGASLTANIRNNTLIGRGPLDVGDEVQNGVLVFENAAATVMNNAISAKLYTPATWTATGILLLDVQAVTVRGNTVSNSQTGIAVATFAWAGPANDNHVVGNTVVDAEWGISLGVEPYYGYGQVNNNKVVNNTISRITGTGTTGIEVWLLDGYGGEALNNKIIANFISGYAKDIDDGGTATKVHANVTP